jgi:hypothetical protein
MRHLDEVMPTDAAWDVAFVALAGELVTLRTRVVARAQQDGAD